MRQAVEALRAGEWVFGALADAWGNKSHSLRPAALQVLYRHAVELSRPVLDIGSGLSTIVAAVAAERSGVPVYALENDLEQWERVNAALDMLQLKAGLYLCPMSTVDRWYQVPADLPGAFGLVVVDGPMDLPNRGRVYGSIDLTGAVVIADDMHHPQIARPFDRWVLETGRTVERFENFAVAK